MEEGDTEVDEALVHVVEVDLKQRTSIGKAKGKQRAAIPTDQGKQLCDVDQQCDREPHLQIFVGLPTDQFSQRPPPFNLATMTSPSLNLISILTTLLLMAMLRILMTGLVTNTSQNSPTRIRQS